MNIFMNLPVTNVAIGFGYVRYFKKYHANDNNYGCTWDMYNSCRVLDALVKKFQKMEDKEKYRKFWNKFTGYEEE